MSNSKQLPLITKEEFVKVITFLEEGTERFEKLVALMEEMSPGFYVDFFPQLPYQEKIIRLLELIMYEESGENSIISYFVYECQFGHNEELYDSPAFFIDNKPVQLKTAENLYDILVELNFTTKEGKKAE